MIEPRDSAPQRSAVLRCPGAKSGSTTFAIPQRLPGADDPGRPVVLFSRVSRTYHIYLKAM